MGQTKKKRILQVSLVIISIACIAAGIMRLEVLDVISNAKILCFSCIGLK